MYRPLSDLMASRFTSAKTPDLQKPPEEENKKEVKINFGCLQVLLTHRIVKI
jgi:hypothetical protein